jgi:hypothetical protein
MRQCGPRLQWQILFVRKEGVGISEGRAQASNPVMHLTRGKYNVPN